MLVSSTNMRRGKMESYFRRKLVCLSQVGMGSLMSIVSSMCSSSNDNMYLVVTFGINIFRYIQYHTQRASEHIMLSLKNIHAFLTCSCAAAGLASAGNGLLVPRSSRRAINFLTASSKGIGLPLSWVEVSSLFRTLTSLPFFS